LNKDTYIPPRPTPRMPPVEDVNNTDIMLGSVLLAFVIATVILAVIWAINR
jgi:hypothetical protein